MALNVMILTGTRRLDAGGVAFVLPIFFSSGESRAETYTWTQFGNGSFDWSSSGNWASSGTAVSGAGNGVVFGVATGAYSAVFTTTPILNYGGASFLFSQPQLTG